MQPSMSILRFAAAAACVVAGVVPACRDPAPSAGNLPVIVPPGLRESATFGARNPVPLEAVNDAVRNGSDSGLAIVFPERIRCLDGSTIRRASLYGSCVYGPARFASAETGCARPYFRFSAPVVNGRGFMDLRPLLAAKTNSEGWTDRGDLAVRFDLHSRRLGRDRHMGRYEIALRFHKDTAGFTRLPAVCMGPCVNLLTSDRPDTGVIALQTDAPARATVRLEDGRSFTAPGPEVRHAIGLSGLRPATAYRYEVLLDSDVVVAGSFTTAPPAGADTVVFAVAGDCRDGIGSSDNAFMGVNVAALDRIMRTAMVRGAQFFVFNGDMITGHTSVRSDFESQLYSWTRAVAGFWCRRPIFALMGNHEALLRHFRDGTAAGVRLDRWPYHEQGTEAVFSDFFVNPCNGPEPSDPRRPAYRENVYSFTFGNVRVLCLNNVYWYSNRADRFGGSPEGYILEDQVRWIEEQVGAAESDFAVRHVFVAAHEPFFPCGGHLKDALWYGGDNRVRAHVRDSRSGQLVPEPQGIVDARNRLVRLFAASRKVVAVFGSDEHAYYRVMIDRTVPVGDPARDDPGGGGVVCDSGGRCSPLDLPRGVWYLTCGNAGAPYYAEEPAPWNSHWKRRSDTRRFYAHSSQEHVAIVRCAGGKVTLTVVNGYEEVIDSVGNLAEAE